MQYGFVIDHSRCIGCHACTVACKSENEVPVDSFRTWVKYTEEGSFPEVKRSFGVLRCNQCTEPSCVDICPVNALVKREDGIVDVDPAACVGCKGCMQACPYDALYINPDKGTAEKCHFCAHRTEVGLAPACAVACPTEAIIPGDFDDPESRVARLRAEGELTVRKPETGNSPNVYYREATPAVITPLATQASTGSIWSAEREGEQLDAQRFDASENSDAARTVYEPAHPAAWGSKIVAYLFFKALAAGIFLAGLPFLAPFAESTPRALALGIPGLALAFLSLTLVLLVADLKRPERFYYFLTRANWGSWLIRGSVILTAYALLLCVWILLGLLDRPPSGALGILLAVVTALAAGLSAAYTGWLFAQAKARVLWMRTSLALHLFVKAFLAGCASLLLLLPLLMVVSTKDLVASYREAAAMTNLLGWLLLGGLLVHLVLTLTEGRFPPSGREAEYARVMRLVTHGPYAARHWGLGILLGIVVPALLLPFTATAIAPTVAGLLVLVGLFSEDRILIGAGQALPIS